jgi:hypothetical protein
LALSTAGCSTTEGRCEDLCQWLDDCGTDPTTDCKSSCESDYDDSSDACQDAFDEFADCISDEDLQCSAVANNCDGSASKFITECGDE